MWLTEEAGAFVLLVLPTAIVAALLVVYFDWRVRLINQIRDERNGHGQTA